MIRHRRRSIFGLAIRLLNLPEHVLGGNAVRHRPTPRILLYPPDEQVAPVVQEQDGVEGYPLPGFRQPVGGEPLESPLQVLRHLTHAPAAAGHGASPAGREAFSPADRARVHPALPTDQGIVAEVESEGVHLHDRARRSQPARFLFIRPEGLGLPDLPVDLFLRQWLPPGFRLAGPGPDKPRPGDLWGIYLVDVFDNILLLKEIEDYALLEPIPLRATKRPPVIIDRVDTTRKDAVVYVEDVYAGPGLDGVPKGAVKNLRLFTYHFGYRKVAGIDHRVGADGPWEPKRVLGTVPVEEDGSAIFSVPANTPISSCVWNTA